MIRPLVVCIAGLFIIIAIVIVMGTNYNKRDQDCEQRGGMMIKGSTHRVCVDKSILR